MTFIHQLANRLYSELVRIHANGSAVCTYDEIAEKLKCDRRAAIRASDLLCNSNPRISKDAIEALGNGDYVIRYTIVLED